MNSDFARIITLLRKEKGISQKQAACSLGVSQALLSHYEKGIRECGLSFLVKTADFYNVSVDYLLGRSLQRNGATLSIDDIPEPDSLGKNTSLKLGLMPTLNKKLISNSLNILFDLLSKINNKALINEVSSFLMIAVYRMFRIIFSSNPKNHQNMFSEPKISALAKANAVMTVCEANANAIVQNQPYGNLTSIENPESIIINTESLTIDYPMFASSLLNVIQNSESKINNTIKN